MNRYYKYNNILLYENRKKQFIVVCINLYNIILCFQKRCCRADDFEIHVLQTYRKTHNIV